MSQKLPINGFKWVEELSQFKEDFIRNYHEDSNKGYFLEVDVQYPKNLFNLHSDLPFLHERNKILKCNKLVCNAHDNKNCCSHKGFKKSTKSQINTKKKAQSNSI